MEENRRGAEDDIYLAPTEKETADITAEQNESSEPVSLADTEVKKIHKNAPTRVSEIRNQRTEHSKTFKMSDGTEQVVFHAAPIHAPGEKENEFEDVDLSLVMDEEGKHFKNAKGGFKAKFSCDDSDDELFSIEKNGCSVTVFAKKNKNISKHGVSPKFTKLAEGREKLSFKKALAGADLEYSLKNDGVKEDILVKTKKKTYVYPFVLKCTGVTAMLDEETNRVAFVDSANKEVFHIPAPFMKDASGVESTAVKYQMEQVSADEAHLSVIADSAWINDEARAMPVVIDPQIKISEDNMHLFGWKDGSLSVSESGSNKVGIEKLSDNIVEEIVDCSPINKANAVELEFNKWRKGRISAAKEEIWYKINVPTDCTTYTILTKGSLDTMGYLYDSNYNLITSNDDYNSLNFSITSLLACCETYYLKVRAYGEKRGDFQVGIGYECETYNIREAEKIVVSQASFATNRLYMNFKMPSLPKNPRIKKAELVFHQEKASLSNNTKRKLGLYHVPGDISNGGNTPNFDGNLIDYDVMFAGDKADEVEYAFDISTLVDDLYDGESSDCNLVLKLIDESLNTGDYVSVFGIGDNEKSPEVRITYDSNYAVNTSYQSHTHTIGKFGQAAVDLKYGNLTFDFTDFAWAGNRMPITIKHLYNSLLGDCKYTAYGAPGLNVADFDAMNIGKGFKLNVMQSMREVNGEYICTDENGAEIVLTAANDGTFKNDDGDLLYNSTERTLTIGDEKRIFDDAGRLIKIAIGENNNNIIYENGRITSIVDGASRSFVFNYSGNNLVSIVAPGNKVVTYAYTDDLLTNITYPDGSKAVLTYDSYSMPKSVTVEDAGGNNVYRVSYEFDGYRVSSVTEHGFTKDGIVDGSQTSYDYSIASGRTIVTTTERGDNCECDNAIKTVYTFDDEGNVISDYVYTEDSGNTGVDGETSGIHPYAADGGASVIRNNTNMLYNHTFASYSTAYWNVSNECCCCTNMYVTSLSDKFRKFAMVIDSTDSNAKNNTVFQNTVSLAAGEYTFSAYIRVARKFYGENPGAFIRVSSLDGTVFAVSEKLVNYNSQYIRLIAPFEIKTSQSVKVEFVLDGDGLVYVCAPQLENNPFANDYNMLQNGNFELGYSYWNRNTGCVLSGEHKFNMSTSMKMKGDVNTTRCCSQVVYPIYDRTVRETFTLSGWAKGYGLPTHDRNTTDKIPTFRLRAAIYYLGETEPEEQFADFSPCTEEWQFASVQFSKEKFKSIRNITIYCDYDYNFGSAWFDDIQLIRNSIETGLTANDFVTEDVDDVDYSETESTDNESSDAIESQGFAEVTDAFGNTITETTFTDGEFGTIYRAFGFNAGDEDMDGKNVGNDLVSETDARGNKTTYEVDANTSRNKEVTDRCGNKTEYTYDNAGRTTKVTSKNADGAEIANVSYAYDAFDNMTEIARGDGMKYALKYNAFHNLESIGVDGKAESLIQYTYKNGNGRLKEITYANGDKMHATYNSTGQMVGEVWTNEAGKEIAKYRYVYDGQGNIVRSIDILGEKEYNYIYNESMLIEAITYAIELSGENVVGKIVLNTIRYIYDSEGKQTKKILTLADGTEQVYLSSDEDNSTSEFIVGDNNIKTHSKTDSFGRKLFDEFQLGSGFVSRQFSYHAGEETREHKENAALKSSPTTQLVSGILLSDGRTLSYEYDAEERITSVTESYKTADNKTITNITEYTYDALGQLLTEAVNGSVVNSMKYDNYGNIVSKNGKEYLYDTTWRDLLKSYDGYDIEYDAQGNPVKYLGHTLTWEKGRQLKSFDNNTYTYNANGIRTSKTVNGVTHEYTLDGTKILRETWGENTLIPIYDDEESVCGIIYNGTPHYFLKNLQCDIIAIANARGEVEARYTYDAWGAITNISGTDEGISIAVVNPFRYRSYYYDVEIGLYYLQTRYYSPIIGRFINADEAEFVNICRISNGTSLYAYCVNDCVNDDDSIGLFPVHIVAGVIMGIFWAVIPRIISDIIRRKMSRISDYVCDAISGALYGLLTSLTGNSTLASIISTFTGEVARFLIQNGPKLKTMTCNDVILNFISIVLKTIISGISDKLAGKIISKLRKKSFSPAQTRNYFKNTKYLKSAFGIGNGGKTGSRVWFKETGLAAVFVNFLNNILGI